MSTQLFDDADLGFFANVLGIVIFVLITAYHYVTADPKYTSPLRARPATATAAMSSFTGGQLKLKGSAPGGVGKAAKAGEAAAQEDERAEGAADRRTAAEKKHDEMLAKREEQELARLATKSHKDRIKEFNDYLSNLSEHHDIPRVGPG
eukprot:CAMPEP_0177768466 /NCGR_PEP_ID=MMETSP0491_2-20121128/9735_1 /TAXON_ID=63592 /ORGANISM="Tetraselmis chuii, Strain PLY429" /LENGTH=148 /DNA_ID=CAMNT_0019285273 /DNA_START=106 /DNA_END=554 /DNA_ORIENTATION=+